MIAVGFFNGDSILLSKPDLTYAGLPGLFEYTTVPIHRQRQRTWPGSDPLTAECERAGALVLIFQDSVKPEFQHRDRFRNGRIEKRRLQRYHKGDRKRRPHSEPPARRASG